MDDESANGLPGSSAFLLSEFTLPAYGYLVITLPESAFALNNTNDALRLIWPDGKVADQVTYDSAKEEQSYAKNSDGSFAWTQAPTKGRGNKFSQPESNPIVNSDSESYIKINEVFPNPSGSDSGKEWVKLVNTGSGELSLHGWILDDGEIGSPIGSNAWEIQNITVKPQETVVLTIPAGKFALNNTDGDTLRMFNSGKTLVDSVKFDTAKEGLSFEKIDGKWLWTAPSKEQELTRLEDYQIIINEVFPEPKQGSEEFIELMNIGNSEVDLTGWVVADNAGKFKIESDKIGPNEFFVIKKSTSHLALNNSGPEVVRLSDSSERLITELEFEDPVKGQSLNYLEGDYLWSVIPTPGKANQIKTIPKSQVKGKSVAAETFITEFDDEALAEPESLTAVEEPILPMQDGVAFASSNPEYSKIPSGNVISNANVLWLLSGWLLFGFVIGVLSCYIYFRKKSI